MTIFKRIKQIISDDLAAENGVWLIWSPFWFALGIAIYFGLPTEPNVWLVLGVTELWLLLLFLARFHQLRSVLLCGFLVLCGFLNIYAHTLYQTKRVAFLPPTMTYLNGYVQDISYNNKGRQRLLLREVNDYDNPLKGRFRITVTNPHEHFVVGECVEMVATVFPPSRIPVKNGFQLNRKYFYEQISAIGYANSEVFTIKCPVQKFNFKAKVNAIRQKVSEKIAQTLPPSAAGVADALLIGEKTLISPQITDNYRGSGLAHFLSVSGLHMGAIATLIFFLVRLILALFPSIALRFDTKKPAAIAAILGSATYLLLSGMAIPAERAFLMTTVVLIGVLFNRQAISMRMVSMAALVILLLQPQALISISFQMSFTAVYALVAFYEAYAGKLAHTAHRKGFFRTCIWYLAGILLGDLVASLATTPLAIYHFHQVAIYTSLGNLLAGPIIGLWLMPNILLCLATLPFAIVSYPLQLLGFGIDLLNRITATVAALPNSLYPVSSLSFGGFIVIIIGGYWLCVWRQKWRLWGIVPIMFGVVSMFCGQQPDVVIAPQARAIAARDEVGKMVLLTKKTDLWLKKIWHDNFNLQNKNTDIIYCNNEGKCNYNNFLEFDSVGQVWLHGKKVDVCSGGYYYGGKKPHFEPLWDCGEKRLWTVKENLTDKR